jgi:DNA-binding FrmR family transcriptional regulator
MGYMEVCMIPSVSDNECCEYKMDIGKRLNRIEGQVKGIRRMIEEDKNCVEVLTQIAAVRAAINKVGGIVLEKHSKTCMQTALLSDN